MSSRRDILKGIVGGGALLASSRTSLAQSLCSVWDKTLLWDVRHALWGSVKGDETCVYLVGAPWCPFSRQAVSDYLSGRLPFELRVIPIDVVQVRHRAQQADIVMNNVDGLRRTFLDKDAKTPSIQPELQKLIHDANFIAQHGFQQRFADLKSPTFVYETTRGAASLVGHKPWPQFASNLRPDSHQPTDFSRQLETILAETKKLPKTSEMKTMYRTAVHALPDAASPSSGCVSYTTFKAVGEIRYKDIDWVKVQALETNEQEAIFGYVDRRDVQFA